MMEVYQTPCPECGDPAFHKVDPIFSKAEDGSSYLECLKCNTCYTPSHRPPHWEMVTIVLIGTGLLALAMGLFFWNSNPDYNNYYGLLAGFGALVIIAGIRNDRLPEKSRKHEKVLELVTVDNIDEMPSSLRTWLEEERRRTRAFRFRRRWLGRGFGCVGSLLTVIAFACIKFLHSVHIDFTSDSAFVGIVVIFLVLIFGFVLFFSFGQMLEERGKGLTTPLATEVLSTDQRRPIFLLRAFEDDSMPIGTHYTHYPPASGPSSDGMSTMTSESVTLETMLAAEFAPLGPLVTIGRPGEMLPPVGASRVWIGNEHWQSRVLDLLEWARFVVMVMGNPRNREGLAWEIQRVFSIEACKKLILIIPPRLAESDVKDRWAQYDDLSGGHMPPYCPQAAVVHFDSGWIGKVELISVSRDHFLDHEKLGQEYKKMIHNACYTLVTADSTSI